MPDAPLRLDMARALALAGDDPAFTETGAGPDGETGTIRLANLTQTVGDVALARAETGASYHLAIVCDDADQGITHVIRGQDLFSATAIHVLLQRLLGMATPTYHHHRLIRDEAGRRLAKRDDARAIATYRAEGLGRLPTFAAWSGLPHRLLLGEIPSGGPGVEKPPVPTPPSAT